MLFIFDGFYLGKDLGERYYFDTLQSWSLKSILHQELKRIQFPNCLSYACVFLKYKTNLNFNSMKVIIQKFELNNVLCEGVHTWNNDFKCVKLHITNSKFGQKLKTVFQALLPINMAVYSKKSNVFKTLTLLHFLLKISYIFILFCWFFLRITDSSANNNNLYDYCLQVIFNWKMSNWGNLKIYIYVHKYTFMDDAKA